MARVRRSALSKTKPTLVPDFFVGGPSVHQFEGLVTALTDAKKLKPGAYIDGKNWITGQLKDHIELRTGVDLVGTGKSGAGKITGGGVGVREDGTEVMFRSYGRKVEYLDEATQDWIECGSNLLPAAASGEDVSFAPYNGLAGAFMFVSSPNSSIYKIPLANPGSPVDQNSTTYRGRIIISANRMFLWARITLSTGFADKTGEYLSRIDKTLLSSFPAVTGEAYGTGNGVLKTFAHTLAQRTGVRTVFGCTVTDGVETFLDNKNGVMVGSLGGTGTINYGTGAVSVTFNTAPANLAAITTDYQYEDSTSGGICDFTYTSPTRVAGEGSYFRQDDGGENMFTLAFNSVYYMLHRLKAWVVNLSSDDTKATNLPWRDRLGIPYHRGAFANGDGITLIDYTDKNNPRVRRLEYNLTNEVVPKDLSEVLNLAGYQFDYAVAHEFSNYDVFCFQKKTLGVADAYNSQFFIRNKTSGLWDKLEIPASVLWTYKGNLYAGDFVSNNVFKLFTGASDEGYIIDNFITFGQYDLGIKGLKKTYKFEVDGFIAPDQVLQVWLAYDNAQPVLVGTISGTGSYVDVNQGAVIGGGGIGSDVIGSSGTPNAFHFARSFQIVSPYYEYVQPKLLATNVGALAINYFGFVDNRFKGRHKLPQYDN